MFERWAVNIYDTQKLHTSEMRMLIRARGKTKKDNIKNEDIWREANIKPIPPLTDLFIPTPSRLLLEPF